MDWNMDLAFLADFCYNFACHCERSAAIQKQVLVWTASCLAVTQNGCK
jgi:hypothetical protein